MLAALEFHPRAEVTRDDPTRVLLPVPKVVGLNKHSEVRLDSLPVRKM